MELWFRADGGGGGGARGGGAGRHGNRTRRRRASANQGADRPTTRISDQNDSIDSLLFNEIGL